jgi:hypothetical protein
MAQILGTRSHDLFELNDIKLLIANHSMVIELLDENGDIADQQIIFID